MNNERIEYDGCQIKDLKYIYERYLPRIGTFVEIGAYDGITHSNTFDLLLSGWKGVYVEPVPQYFNMLIENVRGKNARAIQCAVGDTTSMNDRLCKIMVAGEWSTTKQWSLDVFNNKAEQVIEAPILSMREIVDNEKLEMLDLLVIDTEGNEWEIIKSFDEWGVKPKMLIVELHALSPKWQANEESRTINMNVTGHLLERRYSIIYSDDINTIFVR